MSGSVVTDQYQALKDHVSRLKTEKENVCATSRAPQGKLHESQARAEAAAKEATLQKQVERLQGSLQAAHARAARQRELKRQAAQDAAALEKLQEEHSLALEAAAERLAECGNAAAEQLLEAADRWRILQSSQEHEREAWTQQLEEERRAMGLTVSRAAEQAAKRHAAMEKAAADLEVQLAAQTAGRQEAEAALIEWTQRLRIAQERIASLEAEQSTAQHRADCLFEELSASRQFASAEQRAQAGAAEARRSEELAALASRFQSVLSNREARAQALQEELAAAKAQLAMHTALLQQQHDQLLLTV